MNTSLSKTGWSAFYVILIVSVFSLSQIDSATATFGVFFVSLLFFHVMLIRFSQYEFLWKATDYLFEVVAIVSIIAAVSGLSAAADYKKLQEQYTERKLAQVNFIYTIESTVTNDCNPLPSREDIWTPTPEPFEGECDRITHFLPQLQYAFDQETGPENMTYDSGLAFNLLYDGEVLEGSWSSIQSDAKRFIEISKLNKIYVEKRDQRKSSPWLSIANIENIFYWHHLLAFLLALKIARISMDVFKIEGKYL